MTMKVLNETFTISLICIHGWLQWQFSYTASEVRAWVSDNIYIKLCVITNAFQKRPPGKAALPQTGNVASEISCFYPQNTEH